MKKAAGSKAFWETFSTLTRTLRGVLAEMYGDAGVGSTQAKFMRHIARSGRISQAELARATMTDAALTGRALLTLIERGAVRRERSKTDRREYLVELGPNGADILAQIERVRGRLADRVVRPLDDRDLKDFDRIARKLFAAIADEASTDETAPKKEPKKAKKAKRTRP